MREVGGKGKEKDVKKLSRKEDLNLLVLTRSVGSTRREETSLDQHIDQLP